MTFDYCSATENHFVGKNPENSVFKKYSNGRIVPVYYVGRLTEKRITDILAYLEKNEAAATFKLRVKIALRGKKLPKNSESPQFIFAHESENTENQKQKTLDAIV